MHNGIWDLPHKSPHLEFRPELSLMKYSCHTRPQDSRCSVANRKQGCEHRPFLHRCLMPQNSSSQGWPLGSPGVGAGCQGNFIWEGTATGKPTAAVCLQQERRDRIGLAGFIRSALALCTQVCDALVPKHLAGNKCPQARQSYPTIQSACKRPSLAIEPELASFVPEAVLSKKKGRAPALLLQGQTTGRQQLLWWASRQSYIAWGNLTCRKGNSLTYVPVSMFNWQPEIKVSCGSKDREGVGETSSASR